MKSNTAITLFSTLYCIIFTAAEEILFSNYIDLPDPEPINKKSNKNQFTSRIVGGHDVDDWKTYPFIVSWYQGWNYYPSCGKCILSPYASYNLFINQQLPIAHSSTFELCK